MEQSEQGGFDHFLDMHMYMTSALRKTDVKAIGLQMALDLIHKKQKRDLITGLKTKTQAGRPDWEKVCKLAHASNKIEYVLMQSKECAPPPPYPNEHLR